MDTNAEPLQGSLFGDPVGVSPGSKADLETRKELEEVVSDENLTKDAKARPRPRKSSQKDLLVGSAKPEIKENPTLNTDLPAWSHHNLVEIEQLTPVLRHYVELKQKHPERILLYRLGDFFECFFEDAIKLSQLLELTLTGKEGGKAIGRVPMAGIPHHAAERYCADLVGRGLSVAICDQLEITPSKGKLIKRGITRVLTPGTILEEGMLQARRNNWLAAVLVDKTESDQELRWGLATADISTGDFIIMERSSKNLLAQELAKIEASELISGNSELHSLEGICPDHIHITKISQTLFSKPEAEKCIKSYYKLHSLNGLGINECPLALKAAGGLLSYLKETNPGDSDTSKECNNTGIPLDIPKITSPEDCLIIDAQTRRNLEITTTQKDGQFHGSLLWAIDRTLTAMGGRHLRRWVSEPLINHSSIYERQEIVSELVQEKISRQSIKRLLRSMGDLERLAGRAGAGKAGPRELVAIADGIERLPRLSKIIQNFTKKGPEWINHLRNLDPDLIKIASNIRDKIIDNPPLSLNEGGILHDGVDPLLDGIRNQIDDQNAWLNGQEALERKKSGNPNLRLQYHRTFGYFLAVSKAKSSTVPDHWIRRQTLANEERFITPDLKSKESKIFQSKAKAAQREYELICELRTLVGNQASIIRKAAKAVAGLDALTSLAEVAAISAYCPPTILKERNNLNTHKINLKDCRHPVVEQMLVEQNFVANDLDLGNGTDLIILTGPNASGKSCYLRQIGLIQLLAQIGSWVPAKSASVSIADRIFTRVGAVDDLAAGQSTFMVEMCETAYILRHASNHSLVLLDEIGRGTATYDGLSIAWSVSEALAKKIKSKTIFATHYHELNKLENSLDNVANFQVLVKETEDDLFFLHEVAPGGASRSYGIEAARLAGVPQEVINRAKEILCDLEKQAIVNTIDSNIEDKKVTLPKAA